VKKLIGIAALLLSTQLSLRAEEPQTTVATSPPTVTTSKYPALRVGDIAPQFSLQDVNHKLINSRDYLGQSAQMWAVNNSQGQPVFTFRSIQAPNLAAVSEAKQRQVNQANSAFPDSGRLTYMYSEVKFPIEAARAISAGLHTVADKTTVLLIDRAGFIDLRNTRGSRFQFVSVLRPHTKTGSR
jgi:hypothetical protein